jgi:RimJ/RimL family protein N-acetyltransferase
MPDGMTFRTSQGMLSLRPEKRDASEEAFLYLLFASNKWPEMALMPIDAGQKEFLLQLQFRSMMATYRQQFPKARYEIIELDRWPIGRLVTDVQERRVYYVDFALLPQAQGGGIGTQIMAAALDEPRRLRMPARANVVAHNVASLRMFDRLGFVKVADNAPYVTLERPVIH